MQKAKLLFYYMTENQVCKETGAMNEPTGITNNRVDLN